MDWCEDNDSITFSAVGNRILAAASKTTPTIFHRRRVKQMRSCALCANRLRAKSWRASAGLRRIEATELGWISAMSSQHCDGLGRTIYDTPIARAARWKSDQIAQEPTASDRTSCRAPLANQMRLILHTAPIADARIARRHPKTHPLAVAEFVTLREKLSRSARASSRPQAASACARHRLSSAGLFDIWRALQPAGRERRGRDSVRTPRAPIHPTPSVRKCGSTSENTQCGIAYAIMSRRNQQCASVGE